MKALLILPVVLLVSSCEKPVAEVEVTSTRPLNSADESPRINASDDEQFLPPEVLAQINAQQESEASGEWTYILPEGWSELESSQFREVNITFGTGETPGELYVTTVGGTLQDNIRRWFGQFAVEPPALTDLVKVPFLGEQAYFVEAQGRYEPGMRKPSQDGQALLGVVGERNGRIVTVKMVGPEEIVLSQRSEFIKFISSLKRG